MPEVMLFIIIIFLAVIFLIGAKFYSYIGKAFFKLLKPFGVNIKEENDNSSKGDKDNEIF